MPKTHSRPQNRTLRRVTLVGVAAAALLTFAACTAVDQTETAPAQTTAQSASPLLAEHGLAGKDAATIIDELEQTAVNDRPTSLMASVRPDELQLSDTETSETTSLDMPDDRFYLSIAPYMDETHECYFHSLTTCTGELGNEDVHLTITDSTTGEVLMDETRTSADNGFVGLWLPRDLTADVTIDYDGLTATTPISTVDAEDPTCLTTMKLG